MKIKIIYVIVEILFFTIMIGLSKFNKKMDIKTTKVTTNNIGICCAIAQLVMMFYPYSKDKMIEVLAYSMVIVVLIIAIIIFLKEGAVNKYLGIQNIIISVSTMGYMYLGNVNSRCGHWMLDLIVFALVGITLGMDYNYVDMNLNSSIEEYKSILSIGTISGLMLGFVQLQWTMNNSQIIAASLVACIMWIAYFIKFRREYIKNNKEAVIIPMLMIIVQAVRDFKSTNLIKYIIIAFIIYEIIKFIKERNYDNWIIVTNLLVIGSTITKMNLFMIVCIYVAIIVLMKIAIKKEFSKDGQDKGIIRKSTDFNFIFKSKNNCYLWINKKVKLKDICYYRYKEEFKMKKIRKCFDDGLKVISIVGAVTMILAIILSDNVTVIGTVVLLYLVAIIGNIIYNITNIRHLGGI